MAPAPSEQLRLFVAVELPPELREALAALQDQLRGRGLDSLRWVRPEAIHLTLNFLGETPAEKLDAIRDALARSVEGVPPHRLNTGPLATFGNRRGPQVVWLGLEGDVEPLSRLQGQVEEALASIGFAREVRPFAPHLTLARVRPESARALEPLLRRAIEEVRPPRAEMDVREVSLMKSSLGPGGAVYQRLAVFPLTPLE